MVKTPHIDKLLENSFIFRNTYVLGSHSGAVCTPSRTLIQTGMSYLRQPKLGTLSPEKTASAGSTEK